MEFFYSNDIEGGMLRLDAEESGTATLNHDDDAANVNWNYPWFMPSQANFVELIESCDRQFTENYNGTGVAGMIFTGRGEYSSNSIFLPLAGERYWGFPIRPVYIPK